MLRFADFYADRQQMTDKPIALPLAVHVCTRGNNILLLTTVLILIDFEKFLAKVVNFSIHKHYQNENS